MFSITWIVTASFATLILIALAVLAVYRGKKFVRQALKNIIGESIRELAQDMTLVARQRAAQDSVALIAERMGSAKPYPNRFALLDAALAQVDSNIRGLYCEFGVWRGEGINYIASKVTGLVHGFDSFEGLPQHWRPGFGAGAFKVDRLPDVRPNVRLYKGWFRDTLPEFKQAHPEPLAFVHIDADLYVSTSDVFNLLGDRIVPGTVIQFDELLNFPGWQNGEWKAFEELCGSREAEVEYIGYVPHFEQVAVRIVSIKPPEALRSQDVESSGAISR